MAAAFSSIGFPSPACELLQIAKRKKERKKLLLTPDFKEREREFIDLGVSKLSESATKGVFID
jgi:hypothetical protein